MHTYGLEAMCAILDASGLGESETPRLVDVTEDGVSPAEDVPFFQWKPCCELDGPDTPDCKKAPGLPIPFTANELAAFMIEGVGAYILLQFGDWETGPNNDELSALGIQANKAREALRLAYDAYRSAERAVAKFDKELGAEFQTLAEELNRRNLEGNARERVMAPGISDAEHALRRKRVKESCAELEDRFNAVDKRWSAEKATWRKAMVLQLLQPTTNARAANISDEADIAPLELSEGYLETRLNGTVINWRYWVDQMPTLNAAQAARLMSALEPDKFENLDSRPGKDDPTKHCAKARKIERLAIAKRMLTASQGDWIRWADEHRIIVHAGLRRAVDALVRAPLVAAQGPRLIQSTSGAIESGKARAWRVKKPKRFQGYGKPLFDLLKSAHAAGCGKPTPRDVLDIWKRQPTPEVTEVMSDGLKYVGSDGNTKPADLNAIRAAIRRMTH
jgi:hypothetical protein